MVDLERIREWLAEDLGRGDVTTLLLVPPDLRGRGKIVAKAPGVLAGIGVAAEVFRLLDAGIRFDPKKGDGDELAPGQVVAELEGPLAAILGAERLALNLLQRLSGIATLTRAYVRAVAGTKAKILDTRKTTPGLRALEKYAVRVGGGQNHRFGLFDGILIKDNHIAAVGGVAEAVRRAKAGAPHHLKVEVEVRDLAELEAALSAGADLILLDNMDESTIREAVRLAGGRVPLEASGNMTLKRVRRVAEAGVDYISVGALTHSAPALDLSLEVTHA